MYVSSYVSYMCMCLCNAHSSLWVFTMQLNTRIVEICNWSTLNGYFVVGVYCLVVVVINVIAVVFVMHTRHVYL